MRAAWLLVVVAACGRAGFEPTDAVRDETSPPPGPPRPRTPLVIDRVLPGEPLDDMTILVRLDDSRFSRELAGTNLERLALTDASGTALAFERIDAITEQLIWLRVPRIATAPTTLFITYDGARSALPAWSEAYAAVWHLDEPGMAPALDATGNDHHANANAAAGTPGLFANGRELVFNAESFLEVPDAPSLDFTQITVSGWRRETRQSSFRAIIGRQNLATMADDFYVGTTDTAPLANFNIAGSPHFLTGAPTTPFDTWYHLAASYDGTAFRLFQDGAVVATTMSLSGPITHSANPVLIGAGCDNAGPCANVDFNEGVLDEVRIERVGRSPAWIAFDVAAMRDEVITYRALEE